VANRGNLIPRILAITYHWLSDQSSFEKPPQTGTDTGRLPCHTLVQALDDRRVAVATPAFEVIAEDFAFLDDWEDRYRHLIEIGKAMPPLDPAFKVPAFKVDGCASQVWIRPQLAAGQMEFQGDSDAMIVRGLIALLHALYAGVPLPQVTFVDPIAEFGRLGLNDHLSSQRSNGVRAMVERIRQLAAEVG
jgi:cysteine desulfuration protein SufE